MTDADRTVLVAAVLSALAAAAWTRHVRALDADAPARRVAELRAANAASLLLAALGAAAVAVALTGARSDASVVDVLAGLVTVIVAGALQWREPRQALGLAGLAFLAHAAVDLAHRPGLLGPGAPPQYLAGCALYAGYMAGICFLVRRR